MSTMASNAAGGSANAGSAGGGSGPITDSNRNSKRVSNRSLSNGGAGKNILPLWSYRNVTESPVLGFYNFLIRFQWEPGQLLVLPPPMEEVT